MLVILQHFTRSTPFLGYFGLTHLGIFFIQLCNKLVLIKFLQFGKSHNEISDPSSMDLRMKHYLDELNNRGVLNNSMVVFLSDHGLRFGPVRQLLTGWLEVIKSVCIDKMLEKKEFLKNLYEQEIK